MLKSYAMTDIGQKRQLNQDYIFVSERPIGNLPNVFIVADGMGGHNAGDYASRYAVETVVEEIGMSFEKNPVRVLDKAIRKANMLIRKRAQEDAAYNGMGTTMVIATCIGSLLRNMLFVTGFSVSVISVEFMSVLLCRHIWRCCRL